MGVKLRRVYETQRARVYTEDGYFLGEIEDAVIVGNKIDSWKIRVSNRNFLIRGIRGLYVKHIMVKAMGEIWIVSNAVYSVLGEERIKEPESKEEFKEIKIKEEKVSENKEERVKIEKY